MIDLVPEGTELARLCLTVAEVAKATGLGKTVVYELIRDGELKSFKVGSKRLVKVSRLLEWMDKMEEEAGW